MRNSLYISTENNVTFTMNVCTIDWLKATVLMLYILFVGKALLKGYFVCALCIVSFASEASHIALTNAALLDLTTCRITLPELIDVPS